MLEDRQHNALAALDVLAHVTRADASNLEAEYSRIQLKLARNQPITPDEQRVVDRMVGSTPQFRNDASAVNWRVTYKTKSGEDKTVTVMALDAAGAQRLVANMADFASHASTPQQRNDAAPELSAWTQQCIRDAENAISRYEALIAGKGPSEMVRLPLGDSRPEPVSYFQKLIADNKRSIERMKRGE